MRLRIRLGALDKRYSPEPYPHEDYLVKRMVVHPRFDPKLLEQDIALFELGESVKFKPHILPICLPRRGESFAHELATVSGWGYVSYDVRRMPDLLRKVDVKVLENEVCRRWLSSDPPNAGYRIGDRVLCAGFEEGGKDSCRGDSGGPLILKRDGRSQLIGLVSWGWRCARPRSPGVYTRVSEYVDWIRDNMDDSSSDLELAPEYSKSDFNFTVSNSVETLQGIDDEDTARTVAGKMVD